MIIIIIWIVIWAMFLRPEPYAKPVKRQAAKVLTPKEKLLQLLTKKINAAQRYSRESRTSYSNFCDSSYADSGYDRFGEYDMARRALRDDRFYFEHLARELAEEKERVKALPEDAIEKSEIYDKYKEDLKN